MGIANEVDPRTLIAAKHKTFRKAGHHCADTAGNNRRGTRAYFSANKDGGVSFLDTVLETVADVQHETLVL